jgi:MGT family glycosyltransferase
MAKVIAHTIYAPGHTYPFLSVLVELQRRGLAVKLCVDTPLKSLPSKIGGVSIRRMRGATFDTVPANRWRGGAERVWLANLAKSGEPGADTLGKLLTEERPDFLLIDPMLWGSMVAAEASGLPWASLAHNPLTIRGCGLDIRGPGLRPARGLWGGLRDRIVDLGLRTSMARPLELVNALRIGRGLRPLEDFRDRYLAAPLIIAATAEPFEYPRDDWPSSLVFVGPLVWEPDTDKPAWLGRLEERPLLLLAGSTVPEYKTASTWISVVFEAFANEALQVVATLPIDEVPAHVPSNFVVTPFVSHRYLLSRASCVICHGGHGITTKALAAGVPVVAIPLALDRFEVARRVEVAGAGVMLLERHLTPARLKSAVRTAIARRAGAERIAESFRRAGGPRKAGDAIESLLRTGLERASNSQQLA